MIPMGLLLQLIFSSLKMNMIKGGVPHEKAETPISKYYDIDVFEPRSLCLRWQFKNVSGGGS